ncbi:MAG: hypothetical protein LBJ09_03720 [Clostridiales bacterium]|jgi:hypothetical protein|nr:hypothetical protein [Clostridiales bacterium]
MSGTKCCLDKRVIAGKCEPGDDSEREVARCFNYYMSKKRFFGFEKECDPVLSGFKAAKGRTRPYDNPKYVLLSRNLKESFIMGALDSFVRFENAKSPAGRGGQCERNCGQGCQLYEKCFQR